MAPLTIALRTLHLSVILLVITLVSPSKGLAAVEPASWPPSRIGDETSRLYVLSFTDQDVAAVTGQVLGAVLETPFDLDPAVTGPLTFHVEARMTRGQLLAAFKATLAARGDALVDRKGVLTVIPLPATPHAARLPQLALPLPTYGEPAPIQASQWATLALAILTASGTGLVLVFVWRSRLTIGWLEVTRVRSNSDRREAVLSRLCEAGSISPETLNQARDAAHRSDRPVEQLLNEMGVVNDEALAQAYAEVTGCAIWRPIEQPILCDPVSLGLAADDLIRCGLIPVETRRRRLVLAALDPLDDVAIARIARETARTVTILVGAPGDIRRAAPPPYRDFRPAASIGDG